MIRCAQIVIAVLLVLATPALAAVTVTQIGANQAASTHSLGVGSVSIASGDTGVATGAMRLASAGDAIVCSDNVGNTYSIFTYPLGAFNQTTYLAWFKYSSALTAGTVTCSDTAGASNFTSATINVASLNNASGEDFVLRNQNGSGSGVTNPTVTSNAASQNGDLLISVYSNAATTVGLSYSEDATHSWTQLGTVNGNTSLGATQAYVTNAGAAGVIHAPTTASRTYGMIIAGFKDAGVVASALHTRSLLGVGQ